MQEYINKEALERRKKRIKAKESSSRTINHDAIKRREARRKAQCEKKKQANQSQQKIPPHDAAKNALGEDLFSQIFSKNKNL